MHSNIVVMYNNIKYYNDSNSNNIILAVDNSVNANGSDSTHSIMKCE